MQTVNVLLVYILISRQARVFLRVGSCRLLMESIMHRLHHKHMLDAPRDIPTMIRFNAVRQPRAERIRVARPVLHSMLTLEPARPARSSSEVLDVSLWMCRHLSALIKCIYVLVS